MLSKLIKYDFRSTWREFAAIYLSILLGVTVFPFITKNISSSIINLFVGLIAFAIVIAVLVVTIGSLFKIFNKNVFSNEGYLTMTLPANETQIVVSKLLVSSFWIISTGIVSTVGIIIFVWIMSPEAMAEMIAGLKQILPLIDGQMIFAMLMAILFLIAATIQEVAKLFLACSITHLKQLNRFRIPAGILSYFVMTWLEFVVVDMLNWNIDFAVNSTDSMSCGQSMEYVIDSFNRAASIGITFQLGFTVLFGIGTIFLLKRKLNLD
ncbi:MAG: hypothetical protein EOM59_02480 [Clostridia bacterium]|nr:hypothetical protein [Clostridia bacterium]